MEKKVARKESNDINSYEYEQSNDINLFETDINWMREVTVWMGSFF